VNKTLKIFFVVMCLFAFTFVGFADAAKPKPEKGLTAGMVYWTSTDSTPNDVKGKKGSYELTLDGSPDTWYYLDVASMDPAPTNGYYAFSLTPPPSEDAAFRNYWINKGVYREMYPELTWQFVMSQILNGNFPMFLLRVEDGNYMLIDGLQFFSAYYLYSIPLPQVPLNPLRLNGDYPQGNYTFTERGLAADLNFNELPTDDLSGKIVTLQIKNPTLPDTTKIKEYDVNLVYWTSTDPTLKDVTFKRKAYQLMLDKNPATWYYLGVSDMIPNPINGYYFVYLTPPPSEDTAFWNYWAAKGVTPDMALDGSWQSVMSAILAGNLPMFLLRAENGNYILMDGLQFFYYAFNGGNLADAPLNPLRLNGDYPTGTYNLVGGSGYTLDWNMQIALPYVDEYQFSLQIN